MPAEHNPTNHSDAEVEASIHAVLDAFQADSPFGAAAGHVEAEFVLECLDKGEVDGAWFGVPNACSCLIGSGLRARLDKHGVPTAVNANNVSNYPMPQDGVPEGLVPMAGDYWRERFPWGTYDTPESNPAQQLFHRIRPGHTPENHAPTAFARDCIARWLAAQNLNGAPVVSVVAQGWTPRELAALKAEVSQ